jgi:hypothetical protein
MLVRPHRPRDRCFDPPTTALRTRPHGYRDDDVTELLTLGNAVPTALAATHRTVLPGEACPTPLVPQDGRQG